MLARKGASLKDLFDRSIPGAFPMNFRLPLSLVALAVLSAAPAYAQRAGRPAPSPSPAKAAAAAPSSQGGVFDGLKFREIGPATPSGRIDDFAVIDSDPSSFYVASATGGVWKTSNRGTTFTPVF